MEKIHAPFEVFYIESMLSSVGAALKSISAIEDTEVHPDGSSTEEILNHFQNIILHAATVSRYFWPSKTGVIHEVRSNQLRKALGVKDNSSLKNRRLRNLIEHFDENLDVYLSKNVVGIFMPAYVGTKENSGIPYHFFKAYFIDTDEFEVLGEAFAMRPIISELKRLNKLLEECGKNGFRLADK